MSERPDPDQFTIDAFLRQEENKSLLRFIACGSVDHGKSSLLGRLLYEAKQVHDDQLEALAADSRRHNKQSAEIDYSLLLDGLAAEREQKITIDVAYRFFSTARRKFIVADAPGHEQYTRNMATGASTADLALILVNAQSGMTPQTRRHSLIVTTLGVRNLVVAVNKMDLVAWSQPAFAAVEKDFRAFARNLNVDGIVFIPTSARGGDNIVSRSQHMDWYRGPTLLDHLEQVEIAPTLNGQSFRMPVQWVNRPDADFRGYCGLIASGEIHKGMSVRLSPSNQTTRVNRIVTADGDLDRAIAGQAVTLTLEHDIDASRGDVISDVAAPPSVTDRLHVRIFWMGNESLAPGRRFLVKLGTSSAVATVAPPITVIHPETNEGIRCDRLVSNEIGHCVFRLDRPVATDLYADNRQMGSLILIDTESFDTVGLGLIETPAIKINWFAQLRRIAQRFLRGPTAPRPSTIPGESHARSLVKAVSWRITGSVDTFLLTFIITGSGVFAGSIALAEIVTKIIFYYGHERAWSFVSWGRG
ncbi:MAG: DUF2061 domain-containing protein [Rhizobiales bacterium]|nr:DUF2061 domain-containing protein [Hyphomicrobiales bacterium]